MAPTFATWLKQQLQQREWSQAYFARRVGASTGSVSMWATGQRIPDPSSIDRIADALMIDVDEVLTRAGHRPALPADELDDIHARLDPHLRKVLNRPDTIDHIVGLVEVTVQHALASQPPPASPPAAQSQPAPSATASPAHRRAGR